MMIDQNDDQFGALGDGAPHHRSLSLITVGSAVTGRRSQRGQTDTARNETICLHHSLSTIVASELVGLRKDAKHCGVSRYYDVCHNGIDNGRDMQDHHNDGNSCACLNSKLPSLGFRKAKHFLH